MKCKRCKPQRRRTRARRSDVMFGKQADRFLRQAGYAAGALIAIGLVGHDVGVFFGVLSGRNSVVHLILDLLLWTVVGGGLFWMSRDGA